MISQRDNWELLQAYVRDRDQAAFARLVSGHIDLVYSAALRQVRDRHLAEEVTQAVFVLLAQKAHSLGAGVILSAYLLKAAYYMSKNTLKYENRRRKYERKAAEMSVRSLAVGDVASTMSDLLDEGMNQLNDRERAAIVLRFFEQRSLAEAGAAMGVSEDAAAMRVSRAIGKLRQFFQSRKLTLNATEAGTLMMAIAVRNAPPQLAETTSQAAMTINATPADPTAPAAGDSHPMIEIIGDATRAMRYDRAVALLRLTATTAAVVLAICVLCHLMWTIARPTPIKAPPDRAMVMD
ncbi:MAG TPA: sigma-70 family RNA polymerase sigma factor [Tepidisphaeraceae bacterium]|jgi:RNA polymerase sigma factor (sigma-70 family)|nr:sigma-70 family RNA polymerase sigma factor [Tepidisphaeraceae bacterium]